MKKMKTALISLGAGVAVGGSVYSMERAFSDSPVAENARARACAKVGLRATAYETTVVPVPCSSYAFDHKETIVTRYDAATDSYSTVSDNILYEMPASEHFLKANIQTPEQIRQYKRAKTVDEWAYGILAAIVAGGITTLSDKSQNRPPSQEENDEYAEDEDETGDISI